MKYKLPIVTVGIVILVVGWQYRETRQTVRAQTQSNSGNSVPGRSAPEDVNLGQDRGQLVVREAYVRLLQIPVFAAEVRQRVDLFGQQLVGIGRYQQMMVDGMPRLRLEMNLPISSELTERLVQVSDGRSLWTKRTGNETTVEVVNLTQVQQVLEAQPGKLSASWMMLGGLPRLLERLHEYFVFDPPVGKVIQKVPVWEVTGTWHKEKLAALLKSAKRKKAAGHVPTVVKIVVGRGNPIPYFPYQIQFGREVAGQGGKEGQGSQPGTEFKYQVTLEFFRVQRAPKIHVGTFQFSPGDHSVEDRTEAIVKEFLP